MRYLTLIISILFSLTFVNAQDEETIIKSIFFDLFYSGGTLKSINYEKDTFLINSTIYKTHFDYDSISFVEETGFEIPERIIFEFRKNVENNNTVGLWNENNFNKIDTLYSRTDTVIVKRPFIQCISIDEVQKLFKVTKKRPRIYSISKLLFDNNKQNAVFDLTCTTFPGSFSRYSILIKKIYGKWVILSEFGFMMS